MPLLRASGTRVQAAPPPLTPALVIRALAPSLSAGRKRRIEAVLRERLLTLTVVLENLYDPHNGAAVLRSCEALGLHHVHVVEGSAPFSFSRKVSQSAHKWLAVYLHRSIDDCADHLVRAGFTLWAAIPPPRRGLGHGARPQEVDVARPAALVFGNEHAGLSARALERCDRSFSIPLAGFGESLNLSVAAAIALARAAERRRELLDGRRELEGAALEQLRAACYAASTPHAPALVMAELARAAGR
jgi:tRNA (guanosine-2'-O-)-methyltransferase